MSSATLTVSKIRNGTVIDHIPAGRSLAVLKVLGITGYEGLRIAILMNVESKKLGRKDIVKIEDKVVDEREASIISLIAPEATINIVRDFNVVEKRNLRLPETIKGLLKCPNPLCVTNNDPEALSEFVKVSEKPLRLRCVYCDTYLNEADVLRQVVGQ
ncbi:MAG: aspartate carbamoyltransferase regulatory subunit [Sulfolobales archaeon]|nr:aspartate carbamoyltransferase regulatory subunit [Sulfolobales archaeon]PVU73180.1 aspartate carbamoyltransferase regulatory subunit [Sulfolobales archaeon SCGC AB-777_J03]MCG2883490.1 aspartate carbamoyltransferase regulatory subunit [Sulfolobales archaeon]MCG2907604.1 aspartate carbamoyltransferase regulatory subunit [Sulfolobales archaeon]MCQ4344428.1 aspartate carbamoyltransferase regulatory subunit [Sulfolobales archaeon]